MLAMIEPNYWNWVKSSTPEQRAEFRERLPQARLTGENDRGSYFMDIPFLADLATDGQYLIDLGIDFSIKRFKDCYRVGDNGWGRSSIGPKTPHEARVTNIQVAIPNLLLWSVDEVHLMEDACTNELQDKLDDGWRILAICPPAAQRRPDYILGRQRVAAV